MRPVTRTWTVEAIEALGAFTSLLIAAEIFALSENHAYELANAGNFPVPVIRVGRQWRVPTAPILAAARHQTCRDPRNDGQEPPPVT
ncbi:DNA-binding protein [Longispora sp. NPDC051575]|uniref:DNA-binding protein n=1 Tax=Longispora sp. NPDC051575 TaxID=3154943 RepID=UPI003447F1DC